MPPSALLPLMIGLACVANEFVPTVLGQKWSAAALPLALLSLSVPFRGLTSFVRQVMGGVGHAGLALKSTLITWVLFFTLIMIGVNFGVMGIVAAVLLTEPIITVITIHLGKQAFDTSFRRIARQLRPAMVCSAVMAAAVFGIKIVLAGESGVVQLCAEILTGGITYLAVLRVCFAHQMHNALALLRR